MRKVVPSAPSPPSPAPAGEDRDGGKRGPIGLSECSIAFGRCPIGHGVGPIAIHKKGQGPKAKKKKKAKAAAAPAKG